MSYTYKFKTMFTKLGLATAPSVQPVCKIVDDENNVLVNSLSATTLSNLVGVYTYEYTSPSLVDPIAIFHTEDATVDEQDKYDYTPTSIINNLISVSDIWSYGVRTLSGYIVSSDNIPTTTSDLTIYNFTDNTKVVMGVPNETDIFFTIKGSKKVPDANSLIQITKLAGLKYINKTPIASATGLTSADGSLSVDINGNMTVFISAGAMSLLSGVSDLFGDIKTKNVSDEIDLVTTFSVEILDTVTHTI